MEFSQYAKMEVVQQMAFIETVDSLKSKSGMTDSQFVKKMKDENFKKEFSKAVAETIKASFEVFKKEQII